MKSYEFITEDDAETGAKPVDAKQGKPELPPAHHAQKTQIAGTLPTYKKAAAVFDQIGAKGKLLDFGAGLGLGAEVLGGDSFEPFARESFKPTFTQASQIPSNTYGRVTSLNVLNVVPREVRDAIVKEIGRVMSPDGYAIIMTRGSDVLKSKGDKGDEPMSVITSINTYQKGFTKAELVSYLSTVLGPDFEVKGLALGPAGALVHKKAVK